MKLIKLLAAGFSMAIRRTVTFRINFVIDVLLSVIGVAAALATVLVVFTQTETLVGWTKPEAFVLIGTFQLINSLKATFIDANLGWFANGVRDGKLDTYLLQPAPSIFLASLAISSPLALIHFVLGLAVVGMGIAEADRPPSLPGIVGWLVLIAIALVISWAIGVLFACLAFWAPRLQLDVFLASAWNLGQYPVDIYSAPLRFVLTYIFPMALIATIPSAVLLNGPQVSVMLGSLAGAGIAFGLALSCWRRGLRRYTGATS